MPQKNVTISMALLLLFFMCKTAWTEEYAIDSYFTNASYTATYDSYEDSDGKMWFAGKHGISCYDGENWTNTPLETSSYWIREDSAGNRWAIGPNNLFQMKPSSSSWEKHSPTEHQLDTIEEVIVTPDSSLWIWNRNSAARFNNGQWTHFAEDTPFSNPPHRILVTPDGHLMVAYPTGASLFYDNTWHPYDITTVENDSASTLGLIKTIDSTIILYSDTVLHTYKDGTWSHNSITDFNLPSIFRGIRIGDYLCISSTQNGAILMSPTDTLTFTYDDLQQSRICSGITKSSGEIVLNLTEGVLIYNPYTKESSYYSTDDSPVGIVEVITDKKGRIWGRGYNESNSLAMVCLVDGKWIERGNPFFFTDGFYDIVKDNDGDLYCWIYWITKLGEYRSYLSILDDSVWVEKNTASTGQYAITGVSIDRKNRLWMTGMQGISSYTKESATWQNHSASSNRIDVLPSEKVIITPKSSMGALKTFAMFDNEQWTQHNLDSLELYKPLEDLGIVNNFVDWGEKGFAIKGGDYYSTTRTCKIAYTTDLIHWNAVSPDLIEAVNAPHQMFYMNNQLWLNRGDEEYRGYINLADNSWKKTAKYDTPGDFVSLKDGNIVLYNNGWYYTHLETLDGEEYPPGHKDGSPSIMEFQLMETSDSTIWLYGVGLCSYKNGIYTWYFETGEGDTVDFLSVTDKKIAFVGHYNGTYGIHRQKSGKFVSHQIYKDFNKAQLHGHNPDTTWLFVNNTLFFATDDTLSTLSPDKLQVGPLIKTAQTSDGRIFVLGEDGVSTPSGPSSSTRFKKFELNTLLKDGFYKDIAVDSSDNIWIATDLGVYRIRTNPTSVISHQPKEHQQLLCRTIGKNLQLSNYPPDIKAVQLELYNVQGRQLVSKDIKLTGKSITIPMKELANGTYVVKTTIGNKSAITKVMLAQ